MNQAALFCDGTESYVIPAEPEAGSRVDSAIPDSEGRQCAGIPVDKRRKPYYGKRVYGTGIRLLFDPV